MALSTTTVTVIHSERARKAADRLENPPRTFSRKQALHKSLNQTWKATVGWGICLVAVLIINIVASIFGYTESLHRHSYEYNFADTFDDFMDDGPSDYSDHAEDGAFISLPFLWTLRVGVIMVAAGFIVPQLFWAFIKLSDQYARLVYAWHLKFRHIRVLEVPNAYKRYWEQIASTRGHILEAIGGSVPEWTEALANNYDVVVANSNVLELLDDPRLTSENRAKGEVKIADSLNRLMDRLVVLQKDENVVRKAIEGNEAKLLNYKFKRILR